MRDPSYLEMLNRGNIAALLGKVSGGLCSIDIDDDDAVAAFLALNPRLRETLQTRRVRGCNVWLRINGDYPEATELIDAGGRAWGEWRCDGRNTMIYGQAIDTKKGEIEPTRYKFVVDVEPIAIHFDEITWPSSLILPWSEHRIRTAYGNPYEETKAQ